MPEVTTLEQTDALNALKAALDRYNLLCLGITDEGDLVEAREEQIDAVVASAQVFLVQL
ncbi:MULTISPECIES: hypothetical protein [unclassified Sphingobium]|uniref:hypothetical protein n=1 Tax=unclassified Sphingobium TaxID=2611147 RepID=UPI0022245D23|nr:MULTISPECIES: hypothetical protein [unclassified Sphingobium]MCW2412918.1 hypothetical protein [Sphingobium sp. B8D3D]MCW2414784.1 hypothetical protein [Sphingobium sp. B8D3A]